MLLWLCVRLWDMTESTQDITLPRQVVPSKVSILGVSEKPIPALEKIDETLFHVEWVADAGAALEHLGTHKDDIVLVDDVLLDDQITGFVREVKRRSPLVPVLVISKVGDQVYQTDLIEAGVDDVLMHDMPADTLFRRLRWLLLQRRQNQNLARRNQDLHSITLISRRLHNADHPLTLIIESIDLICRVFNLYGMTVVLEEGDSHHIYAGTADINNHRRLYESALPLPAYDPFRMVIVSGMAQIYQDINTHPFYTPIPVLNQAASVILLPLKYGDQTLGTLGLFAHPGQLLVSDDLIPFELIAAHLASAYHNVQHYHTQDVHFQSTRQTLRAWQRLTGIFKLDQVAHTLRGMIHDTNSINEVLVWLFDNREGGDQITVSASNGDIIQNFKVLYEGGHIKRLIDQFDARMQPITMLLGRNKQDPFNRLFRAMDAQRIMLIPIVDSLQVLGGVFISAASNNNFTTEDVSMVESLIHAAGQTLERNMLITAMEEQSGRLEAIVRSIKEAVFFVGDTGRIVFTNPQLAELTGITQSMVMYQTPEQLFELLAQKTNDPEGTFTQLTEAMRQAAEGMRDDGSYPIVELTLANEDSVLYVEFGATQRDTAGQGNLGWLGFIRHSEARQGSLTESSRPGIISALIESLSIPYIQLQNAINTLVEHHGTLSHRQRTQFLQKLEQEADEVATLWNNFFQIYQLETTDLVFNQEELDPVDVVTEVLNSRTMSKHRARIKLSVQPPRVQIAADDRYLKQAITNLIELDLRSSPGNAPILVQVKPHKRDVHIIIQDKRLQLTPEEIETLFNPLSQDGNTGEPLQLGLYLSSQIIKQHGGAIEVESRSGWGTLFRMVLPTTSEIAVETSPAATQSRGTSGGNLTILIIEGSVSLMNDYYDRLETEGYEIIVAQSAREAISDLSLARIDLIVIEPQPTDADVIDMCKEIRADSDVPLIVLSERDVEQTRVQALRQGADDYVTLPLSDAELLARLDNIANRKQIAARTHPPMSVGDIYIDFGRRTVYLNNTLLDLTAKEYELLCTLAMNAGQVLTHRQLLEKVWGPEYREETQYLWVNVSRLRKKLEPASNSPRYIHTEPGIGYVFREP